MVPPDATSFISDAMSGYGSKKYRNGHSCVSGLKLLATTVEGLVDHQAVRHELVMDQPFLVEERGEHDLDSRSGHARLLGSG